MNHADLKAEVRKRTCPYCANDECKLVDMKDGVRFHLMEGIEGHKRFACTANDSLADWVVEQLAEARAAQRESDAEAIVNCHGESSIALAARVRANVSLEDANYIAQQRADVAMIQRESDAALGDHWAEMGGHVGTVGDAIRANLTPADAQYIERVRAEAALEEAKVWDDVFPSDWSDERIAQLSQQAGITNARTNQT